MGTKPKQTRHLRTLETSPKRNAAAKVQHAKRLVRTAADMKFAIVWNEARRSWDIHREGVPTGGFAYDRSTAIGLAIKAAGFEAIEGLRAVVTSTLDGKTKIEWSS
jgi:hypothetical protein